MTIPAIAVGIIRIQSPWNIPNTNPQMTTEIQRFFHHPPRSRLFKNTPRNNTSSQIAGVTATARTNIPSGMPIN